VSLATAVVINSACKAMDRARLRRSTLQPKCLADVERNQSPPRPAAVVLNVTGNQSAGEDDNDDDIENTSEKSDDEIIVNSEVQIQGVSLVVSSCLKVRNL